jgi:hypothetical protein
MGIIYAPRITCMADHERFKLIIQGYPADTYDKWLYLQSKEAMDWWGSEQQVNPVDVYPDEFIAFCDLAGSKRTIDTLRNFAFLKGTGQIGDSTIGRR